MELRSGPPTGRRAGAGAWAGAAVTALGALNDRRRKVDARLLSDSRRLTLTSPAATCSSFFELRRSNPRHNAARTHRMSTRTAYATGAPALSFLRIVTCQTRRRVQINQKMTHPWRLRDRRSDANRLCFGAVATGSVGSNVLGLRTTARVFLAARSSSRT